MRLEKLDILRGVAIFLMVLFHLNFSLVYFGEIYILNFSYLFWWLLWKVSALLFIFIAGVSFFLAEQKYKDKVVEKYSKMIIVLIIIAVWISLSTYLLFPEQYIRFWIIHFFALSFFLLLFCRKFRYYNILIWATIVAIWIFFTWEVNNHYFIFLGFTYPWFNSLDVYPIFPYFWVILFWYVTGLFLNDKKQLKILWTKEELSWIFLLFSKMWKKSLLIYLIHPPIITGIIYYINIIK